MPLRKRLAGTSVIISIKSKYVSLAQRLTIVVTRLGLRVCRKFAQSRSGPLQLHGAEAVCVITLGVGVIDAKRLGVGQGRLVGVAVGAFVAVATFVAGAWTVGVSVIVGVSLTLGVAVVILLSIPQPTIVWFVWVLLPAYAFYAHYTAPEVLIRIAKP
jgi:hypothetical protein